jgi:Co/Zn/Cd efflux system component
MLIETVAYEGAVTDENDATDKKLLWTVLIINFSVFAVEIVFGFLDHLMGLVADAVDELSDAFVYGLSLYAIAGTLLVKNVLQK